MKTRSFLLLGLLCAAALGAALTSFAAEKASTPAKPADLQLQINVPPTWRPFLDDRIAESLAGILSDTFKRRGFTGVVDFMPDGDRTPNADLPLLTLNLLTWRIDRVGNAECTLAASLSAPGGEKRDLGIVTQTQITWIQERGRYGFRGFEIADALEDAATAAMRDLYKRVEETHLVRGFPPSKAKK